MSGNLSEEQQIIIALRRIVRAVGMHSQKLAEQYGVTVPQLLTLQQAARLTKASPSVLGREIHISRSTMTGVLERLEKRGLIKRVHDSSDRRRLIVMVTEEGSELLARSPTLLQERFHKELSRLEKWEHTTLLAALQRIAAMMDVEEIPAAPILSADVGTISPQDQEADPDAQIE